MALNLHGDDDHRDDNNDQHNNDHNRCDKIVIFLGCSVMVGSVHCSEGGACHQAA